MRTVRNSTTNVSLDNPGVYQVRFSGFGFVNPTEQTASWAPFGSLVVNTNLDSFTIKEFHPIPNWDAELDSDEWKEAKRAQGLSDLIYQYLYEVFGCTRDQFNDWVESTFFQEDGSYKDLVFNAEELCNEINLFAETLAKENGANRDGYQVLHYRGNRLVPYNWGFIKNFNEGGSFSHPSFQSFSTAETTYEGFGDWAVLVGVKTDEVDANGKPIYEDRMEMVQCAKVIRKGDSYFLNRFNNE